jgi:hypothetical protein
MAFRTILGIGTMIVAAAPMNLAWGQKADKDAEAPVKQEAPPQGHLEVPHDPYVFVPREERTTSPALRWSRNGYVSVQVNVNFAGDNIVGDAANEPSIAVDPTNPNRMVIGCGSSIVC